VEDAGNFCATGGVKIEFGLDANGNNILDAGEINSQLTEYVCNGFQGDIGPAGPAGPAGPSGISSIVGFSGPINTVAANGQNYVFIGQTASVTITSNTQRLTGSASGVLGFAIGTAASLVRVGLCYQPLSAAGTPISNFVGSNYINALIPATKTMVSAAGSVTGLSPATYTVGMCVLNANAFGLTQNDYSNGWVMVTN